MTIQHLELQDAATLFGDALQLFIGRGRRYSAETLAEAADIPARTIYSYMQGSTPSLCNMLRLMAVLPPAFANHVLSHAGLGGVRRLEPSGQACGQTHMARMASRLHKLADALADGRVDHREARELAPEFRELGTECIEFAARLVPPVGEN